MISSLVKRIFFRIFRDIITLFTKRIRNRILLVQDSLSGSNSYALWKLAGDAIKSKYEVVLFQEGGSETDLASLLAKHRLLASSQMIVTTHGSYKPSRKHLHLQLWHGAVVKKNGVMEASNLGRSAPRSSWPNVDFVMSYSETYTTFLNACMFADPSKYVVTGASRNDFLFLSDGVSNLHNLFGDSIGENKVIFFLPTFRDYYGTKQGDRNYNNPFGFKQFVPEAFDMFLKENKCVLIFKPHPHEESLVLDYFRNYPATNLLILRNDDLISHQLDLYELLNGSEILITDYSSVFYDYLLLDRPMIFAPVDIESYKERRGFLVESFETWAPGPKVFDQDTLQKEISRSLADKDYYREQRNWMRDLLHRYKDGESSKRLWGFIDSVLAKQLV